MLHELPYQVHDTLEQLRDGQIEVGFRHQGLEDLITRMDQVFNRVGIAVVAVGGALTSALLALVSDGVGSVLRDPLGRRARAVGSSERLARLGRHPLRAPIDLPGTFPARPA